MALITIDRTVKLGDLLTTLAILISLFALLSTLAKDRISREHEAANRVRSAAAQAITKLDRWKALQLSLYSRMRPEFIVLSQSLAKNFDVIEVRDDLWKRVGEERAKVAQQVIDEQLGTAYADLLAHFPVVRERFMELNITLADIELEETDGFLRDGQASILSFEDKKASYTTAMLGNSLRSVAAGHEDSLRRKSEAALKPLQEFLFDVIKKTDSEIVRLSHG
ncbi:hypothetical protein [Variovorax fucosicus]|uniref:hypothetical protein n=1 Tax=Variovorax fucosicus TaxID=3053517 RepID=UPI0025786167|nr:hypothetical protein [Variovorax sp. J22G47]MDM0059006.1 hypothetical protein [Variovorax sp. J22G47]